MQLKSMHSKHGAHLFSNFNNAPLVLFPFCITLHTSMSVPTLTEIFNRDIESCTLFYRDQTIMIDAMLVARRVFKCVLALRKR